MSKADQIRALLASGKEIKEIAKELGIRYQQVYGVAKKVSDLSAGTEKQPKRTSREVSSHRYYTLVTPNGVIEARVTAGDEETITLELRESKAELTIPRSEFYSYVNAPEPQAKALLLATPKGTLGLPKKSLDDPYVTVNELAIIKALRHNEFQDAYEEIGGVWVFSVIDNSGLHAKVARGVISSLVKKGLVVVYDNDGEQEMDFTEAGREIAKDYPPAR